MKKFECPYCREKTITRLQKAFAGSLKSKGVKCPKCGGNCVNGKESTVFHTVIDGLVFICIVLMVIFSYPDTIINAIVLFTIAFLVTRIFDALFFSLDKTWRNDV